MSSAPCRVVFRMLRWLGRMSSPGDRVTHRSLSLSLSVTTNMTKRNRSSDDSGSTFGFSLKPWKRWKTIKVFEGLALGMLISILLDPQTYMYVDGNTRKSFDILRSLEGSMMPMAAMKIIVSEFRNQRRRHHEYFARQVPFYECQAPG